MNLHDMLLEREQAEKPIRVGVIGAGRFGTMFLAQVRNTPGVRVAAIADIDLDRAHQALELVEWPHEDVTGDLDEALFRDRTAVTPDAGGLFRADIDVIVEATGNPIVGASHALRAFEAGQHVIMVTVEGDALAGPALAKRAADRGLVYSLAYGDQPALVLELVDWARTSGFEVVCAGKGAKYLEHYHEMNPDDVWEHWEFSAELIGSGQLNPYMHTAFRDGTKAAIEMAAVANAAGLVPSDDGLTFTPGDLEEIATICRPREAGGVLAHEGSVDVMSSVTRDGEWIPHNTQEGVFVVVKATNDYVSGCFSEYPWHPDPSKRYAALYRPYHYVGLELGMSIANVALRGAATGAPREFCGDVVATAKKDLPAGVELDGEGGYAVWGKLISARASAERGALPIALAQHVELRRDVAKGAILTRDDVVLDKRFDQVLELRSETEELLRK